MFMQVRLVSLGELKEGGGRHKLDLKLVEDLSKRMQNALMWLFTLYMTPSCLWASVMVSLRAQIDLNCVHIK